MSASDSIPSKPLRFHVAEGPAGLRLLLIAVRDGQLSVEQAMECFSDETSAVRGSGTCMCGNPQCPGLHL